MSPFTTLLMPLGMADLSNFWKWWPLPLIVLVSAYLLTPLLARFTLKYGANFRVERFDPDESPAPDRTNEFFEETAAQLQPCGFEVVDHLFIPDAMKGLLMVFSVMENRESDDAAVAALFLGTITGVTVRQRHIEFSSELIDGTEIGTTNIKQILPLAPFPWKRAVQLDTERDAAALYRLHLCAVGKWATTTKRSLNDVEDWSEEIRANTVREYEGFVDAGYYVLDASGENYRPTWKGAFLMSWQQLWPIGMFRRLACRRRAEALRSQANPLRR